MNTKQIIEILEYCKPHTELMWSAYIASLVMECDFRDVTELYIDNYIKRL